MGPDSGELSAEQIGTLRARLLALQSELTRQDADSAGWRAPVELDQQSVGRLSRMDAMQQQAMSKAEARRRRNDLTRIEHALKLLSEGEYGWCAECGEPIAFKRLQVDPMATYCIQCAR